MKCKSLDITGLFFYNMMILLYFISTNLECSGRQKGIPRVQSNDGVGRVALRRRQNGFFGLFSCRASVRILPQRTPDR
jgi:hypothetical protein